MGFLIYASPHNMALPFNTDNQLERRTPMNAGTLTQEARAEFAQHAERLQALGINQEQFVRSRLRDAGFAKEEPTGSKPTGDASQLEALDQVAPREAALARLEYAAERDTFEKQGVTEAAYVRSRLKSHGVALPARA